MTNKLSTDHLWVARGIGIICVVLGHLFHNEIKTVVYTFHMPLFFILSGIFAHTRQQKAAYIFV